MLKCQSNFDHQTEGWEGKNGSHLLSWITPSRPYLDRAERRNTRRVTEGTARRDGKEKNEKERLPSFLLLIAPALPLTAFLSRRLRDDQGWVSLLPTLSYISRSLTWLLNSLAASLNILRPGTENLRQCKINGDRKLIRWCRTNYLQILSPCEIKGDTPGANLVRKTGGWTRIFFVWIKSKHVQKQTRSLTKLFFILAAL